MHNNNDNGGKEVRDTMMMTMTILPLPQMGRRTSANPHCWLQRQCSSHRKGLIQQSTIDQDKRVGDCVDGNGQQRLIARDDDGVMKVLLPPS